jgi:prohibitin 2
LIYAGKQVAQQEAERAKYEVEQAKEAKKSTIIKAEASAKSIELVGQASKNNPCIFVPMQPISM